MTQDKFFDRKYYLDILTKRVKALNDGYRQNIALLGDELVGKTSIILHFLNRFHDNRILTIYLALRHESLEYFAKRFIGVLLYNFLSNSGANLKEDLNFLINKSENFIPRTVEKIRSILAIVERKRKETVFTDLLSLCDTIYQETQKSCVVILDEFHNLDTLGIKNLYKEWAKILILQKNTMFVIVSSAKFRAKRILSENLSLLFGNFETIEVDSFDPKASDEFLQDRLGRVVLDKTLRNSIINFAGGSPFYLEVVSAALCKMKSQDTSDTPITKSMLIDALQDLMFEETGTLNQRFNNYLRNLFEWRINQDYIWLLYCISNEHNKVNNMAQILHKQKKEIMRMLNQLSELDVINRNGDFFGINDRIFGFWLKFVHQNKTGALSFDANAQKNAFREGIDNVIKEFIINSGKVITDRIAELLQLFGNEVVYIERKRLRLTNFREIKPLKFNSPIIKDGVIGRSTDYLWIIAIKDDLITDDDITEFARECKKYKQKTQRRIFITPIDIDMNVRLKALEEKIWTWNLNNVNLLFDLFNKPAIIP